MTKADLLELHLQYAGKIYVVPDRVTALEEVSELAHVFTKAKTIVYLSIGVNIEVVETVSEILQMLDAIEKRNNYEEWGSTYES